MSDYPTKRILVRHKCGELMLLHWIDSSTPEFCNIKAYFDQVVLATPLTKCRCGSDLIPFRSKEWSEE